MAQNMVPGPTPVNLNEVRGWLRLGAPVDDAIAAQLIRAATSICEAFVGQWVVIRGAEEIVPLRAGRVRLNARPVVAVDTVALLAAGGGETAVGPDLYRLSHGRDGAGRLAIDRPGDAGRVRVAYRAGMAADANGVPEAIRQGIVRMVQHLHDARDAADAPPPAVIAALWQPWRRMTLGSGT